MVQSRGVRIAGRSALWLVTVVEALGMGLAGAAKFNGWDTWARMFGEWGYPIWFMVVVGVWEIVGAIGLLIPRFAPFAAIFLMVAMLGALGTELLNERILGPAVPLIHLALLAVILAARWPFGRRAPLPSPAASAP